MVMGEDSAQQAIMLSMLHRTSVTRTQFESGSNGFSLAPSEYRTRINVDNTAFLSYHGIKRTVIYSAYIHTPCLHTSFSLAESVFA